MRVAQHQLHALLSIASLAAAGTDGVPTQSSTATIAADVHLETCPPPGHMPPIGGVPTFTDSGIALYVGGDYVADGNAAESEGLLVVGGDATFDRASGGGFDVGTAGVGSGITPSAGENMLQVGGDLTVTGSNILRVGLLVGGGAVRAGGTATGSISTNGKPVTAELGLGAALAPHAGFDSTLTEVSAQLGDLPANGTTQAGGHQLAFISGTTEGLQVFTVTTNHLNGKTEFVFDDTPAGSPIVVNVIGASTTFGANDTRFDGVRVDAFASPSFGNSASRILWNFVDATSVTLTTEGQFMGSILAPTADMDTTASTNGRVYVGGDLRTHGSSNEQHNYPWIGGAPMSCASEELSTAGTFDAAKALVGDGAALVPDDTEFIVEYSYALGEAESTTGQLTILADGTVALGPQGLPPGTVMSFTEPTLPALDGIIWGTPAISPQQIVVDEEQIAYVTITNTANAVPAPAGGFSAMKLLSGDAAALVPTDAEFTVHYNYRLNGHETTGTLTIAAGGTIVNGPQNLPGGTVVMFTELEPPEIDGVEWGSTEIQPSTVTITEGQHQVITVTNHAVPAVPQRGGGFSAMKALAGDGAMLVPPSTVFSIAYAYTIEGNEIRGMLRLTSDGTTAHGPQDLPAGTVVSFEELTPPPVDGVTWGEPEISPAVLTIASDVDATVTATNTAIRVAPPTPVAPQTSNSAPPMPTPSLTPASPLSATLVQTGTDPAWPLAIALIGTGTAAVAYSSVRHRRSTNRRAHTTLRQSGTRCPCR